MTNPTENNCPKCGSPITEGAPQGLCPRCVLSNAATVPDTTGGTRGKTRPPTISELSPHFPDLEILDRIGHGGMGAVYKARQPKLDRIVALKILSHELGGDPAFAERFQREARVLARLHHPNIVTVFDTGTAGPYAFLLMEYVDGVNLREAMRTGGFSPMESLTLVQEVCSALKFAHEKGVLHRDIKPENVLLDSSGTVKIADFGIAKLVGLEESDDLTLTFEGSILGSPQYMAPEQIETPGDIDQRADIYSLGVVLYEMLTGELPIGRWSLPSEKRAIDARIDEIVLRTLAKEREARYQNAGEIQTQVEAIRDTPASRKSAPPAPSTEIDWVKEISRILFFLAFVPLAIFMFEDSTSGNDTEILLERADRFPIYMGIAIFLSTVSGILAAWHRLGFSPERASRDTSPSNSNRARHAKPAAILAAISLSLSLAAGIALPFLYRANFPPGTSLSAAEPAELSSKNIINGLIVGGDLLIACITGLLGVIFGVKALLEIRRSGGRKGGLGSALFGVVTWPALLVSVLFTSLITGYRLPPALLGKADSSATSAGESEAAWRQERPELELDLVVDPGLVATIEFIRTDDSGDEQVVPGHLDHPGAYVIASDAEPWRGVVEFGSLKGASISYGPRWLLKIGRSSVDFSHVGAWDFETDEPIRLELSSPGIHRFQVATGRTDRDLPGNLVMQVTGVKRTIPGIPTELMDRHLQEGSVVWIGSAGQIDWIARVREDLEEQPQSSPEPAILADGPKIDLTLTVAPDLVATFELVKTNAVGKEKNLDEHQGFILSSDSAPWSGTVLLAAVTYPSSFPPSPETGREMLSSIRAGSGRVKELNNGLVSNFAYEWNWKTTTSLALSLSKPGQHDFEVASRSDLSETLTLRVTAKKREVHGIPAAALDQVAFDQAVCGLGGDIDWIRYLMEALDEKMKGSNAPPFPREPEPEWREGQPESHVNLTIDPGLVAEIELCAPDKNGERTVLHRGYIVTSDLEPWEGKLRVGSLAGSSHIQWRIDGPYHSATAEIDPGWGWQVEPMATNSELTEDKVGRIRIIVAGTIPDSKDYSSVSFVVNTVKRRWVDSDLPKVLAFHSMGLGEEPDWIEGVRRAIQATEMMNGSEIDLAPDQDPPGSQPTTN